MLILAVEPDRRQSKQLTAVVRSRLNAELIVGDSAERALASLGDRIPDLVLTSALLSPKDESALSDRLRSFGDATSYVQTLTIPVLAPPQPASRKGGVLAALRWSKRAAPVNGCDPAVFADECAAYLERARAEREQRQAHEEPIAPQSFEPVAGRQQDFGEPEAGADVGTEIVTATDVVETSAPLPLPIEATDPAPLEPPYHVEPLETSPFGYLSEPEHRLLSDGGDDQASVEAPPAIVDGAPGADDIAGSLDLLAKDESSVGELRAFDQVDGVWEPLFKNAPQFWPPLEGAPSDGGVQAVEPSIFPTDEILDSSTADATPHLEDVVEPVVSAEQPVEAAVMEMATLVAAATEEESHGDAAIEPLIEPVLEPMDISEAELLEAVQSLQRELDRLDLEEASAGARPRATPRHSAALDVARMTRQPKQDEWGLFDPEQCGFAALVKKLEEITAHPM